MITLCVIFNHHHPRNIPILRRLYAGRFSRVVFLQPMVETDDDDVITSYRGSYTFQGMIADARAELIAMDSSHYIFVQDDMLLDPRLNEGNVVELLNLKPNGGFLPRLRELPENVTEWVWSFRTAWQVLHPNNVFAGSGVMQLLSYLPDANSASRVLEARYGIRSPVLTCDPESMVNLESMNAFSANASSEQVTRTLMKGLFTDAVDNRTLALPFPFARGSADFFVVGGDIFPQFARMMGVTAAALIFPEVAVPTMLPLIADHVTFPADIGRGIEMRPGTAVERMEARELIESFESGLLAVHPIKISRDIELLAEVIRHFDPALDLLTPPMAFTPA